MYQDRKIYDPLSRSQTQKKRYGFGKICLNMTKTTQDS